MASKNPPRWVFAAAVGGSFTALWLMLTVMGIDDALGVSGANWVLPVMGAGVVLGAVGIGRPVVIACSVGLLLLGLVGWIAPLGGLARGYIRNDRLNGRRPDAVIVLSGAVNADGVVSPAALDRLITGLSLLDSTAEPRLVVSRVLADVDARRPVSSDADQRALVELMKRPIEVHRLDTVGSTRGEAVRAKALFDQLGWTSAFVVTSPVHTRRACAAFEAVGIKVICRASADRGTAVTRQETPADRSRAFGQWIYETFGWWEYRLRGWVGPRPE